MRKTLSPLRLVAELLVIITLAEVLVVFLQPMIAPGVTGLLNAAVNAVLLWVLAGPLVLWRCTVAWKRSATGETTPRAFPRSPTIWLPVGTTVTVGLALSLWGAHQAANIYRGQAQLRFDRLAERLGREVERRANLPVYGLMGARGIYAASKSVERLEFRAYVESRDLAREFPGVIGMGFIERVPRAKLDSFIAAERADDAPDFTVSTSGDAPDLYVSKFLEPLASNREAWGFDTGSDPVRREAILRAIRTGQPALTGPVTLFQDKKKQPGFLYLVPVYHHDARVTTPAEREAALWGLTFAPMVIDRIFAGVIDFTEDLVDVEVYDGSLLTREHLLLDGDGNLLSAQDGPHPEALDKRMFHRVITVMIGGRQWSLAIITTPKFEAGVERTVPMLIGLGGTVITLLLASVVLSLAMSRGRALALAREMTASLRATEAEARRLAMVADRTSNAVIITDTESCIEWANAGFSRITGYTLDEVKGRRPGSFLQGPLSEPDVVAIMRQGVASRQGFDIEVINYAKSGASYWSHIEVQPLHDPTGAFTGFMAIESDISDRKAAEQKLQADEQRLVALTTHAPGVFFQFEVAPDDRRSFEFLSAGFLPLFGRDPLEVIDQPGLLYASVADAHRERVYIRMEQAIAAAAPWSDAFPILRPDGAEHWINARSSAFARADGTKVWFGVLADITELQHARHAAEELNTRLADAVETARKAAASAEQANIAKSQFLAVMSHEIRTPMNGVIGMTSLLLDTSLTRDQKEFAEIIRVSGESLLSLINDILDFSKIESGHMDLECEVFSVPDCVESTLDLLAPRAAQKGLELLYEIADGVPNEVRGDITRVRQILVNLVGNALKFTETGEVAISVHIARNDDDGKELLFSVSDTGIGIPLESQGRLFQSFTQVDSTTTRKYGGTGLGLAISKRLAEMMGGRLWMESEPGHGSTFSFTLPAEWIATGPRPYLVKDQLKVRGRRLLVVDDNEHGRRILAALAHKWGMPCTVLSSAAECLDCLRRGQDFDLAILDMQMPGMDGLMLAREIRRLPAYSTLPLVLLSSIGRYPGTEDPDLFAAYLTKPVKPPQLFTEIGQILGGGPVAPLLEPTGVPAPMEGQTHPERILLAEDNPVNQKVALHMLARLGHRADVAGNGLEVLEALKRLSYDIILMDVQMPEMDGLEATRRIRRLTLAGDASPWVIALTANAMEDDQQNCEKAGMDDYLSKPFKKEDLEAVLHRARAALQQRGGRG